MGRTRERKDLSEEEKAEKRNVLLEALGKATREETPPSVSDITTGNTDNYYTLTMGEMDALVSGDMEKIESWVSNLDRDHAARLLRWLKKEGW